MMRQTLVLALGLAVGAPALAARYALLAGASQGGAETEALRYVRNDLDGMRDVLTTLGGFEPRNVVTAYNVSPEELAAALHTASRKVSAASDDLFLFYYSGHADENALHLANRRYPLSQIRAALDSMPARIRIAVLDACQSGGVTRAKGGRLEAPFLFKEDSKVKGLVILYSSSSTEHSQESDAYRNSIFTFHFLNALRGCGDVSRDGKITVNEAYIYSYNRTVASTVKSSLGPQHPGYQFRIQGEGDIVLADLNLHAQGLLFERGVAGTITILDSGGSIVADFVKEAEAAFAVALNAGAYRVVSGRGAGRMQAAARVAAGAVTRLRPSDFTAAPAGDAAAVKGSVRRPQMKLFVGAGAATHDFSSLSHELALRFSNYDFFGMQPQFNFPRWLFRLSAATQLELPVGVILECYGGYSSASIRGLWDGLRVDAISGAQYGSWLRTAQFLDLLEFSTGPGYRLQRGFFAGFSAHIGVSFHLIDFRATADFADSLFDVRLPATQRETGALLLPFGAVEYQTPLGKRLFLGARMRYRYQREARRLALAQESIATFRYNLGGVDGALFAGIQIGGKAHE